jgi:hypothetical protein
MAGQVEKGSIHPVVRAIAPESTCPIPAAPIYYLAPTQAQQSIEVSCRLGGMPEPARPEDALLKHGADFNSAH